MSRTIVVTGFEAFGHSAENPTLMVLDRLRGAADLPGLLETFPLPVDSGRIGGMVAQILDEIRPDLWIALGLASGSAVIAVERIAANVLDFSIPDNAGVRHDSAAIHADGPAAYMATLPVKKIVRELRRNGIPAKVSNSASTYLCNQLMYTVLHRIAGSGLKARAGFIHVPAHPGLVARQTAPFAELPSMGIDLMTEAVSVAIRTSLNDGPEGRET